MNLNPHQPIALLHLLHLKNQRNWKYRTVFNNGRKKEGNRNTRGKEDGIKGNNQKVLPPIQETMAEEIRDHLGHNHKETTMTQATMGIYINKGRGGGRGQGPSWRPERADPNDPQVAIIAQAIGLVMANNGKWEANAPAPFNNLKDQNLKLWLLQCEDYFKWNRMQWKSDQDRIKYALGQMEGEDVSAFALTYRKKMTSELGYLKIEGYEYWEMFHMQCTRFALTHEGEWALAAMEKMKYTGNIDKFTLEFENHNTYVELVGVAMRRMAGRTMQREAIRQLSTLEYPLDSDWMAALRECTQREEIFLEEQSWRDDHGNWSTAGKRKREDKAVTKPRKQKKIYTAEKKAANKAKKENERRETGSAPSKKKVVNTDWATAHQGIKNSIVKEPKNAKQCTRCGFDRHIWVECYQPIQVSAIESRKTFEKESLKRWQAGPITHSRLPQAAAVSRQKLPELEPQVNQIEWPQA